MGKPVEVQGNEGKEKKECTIVNENDNVKDNAKINMKTAGSIRVESMRNSSLSNRKD